MSELNVRRLTIIVWLLAGIAAGLAILIPLLSQGSAAPAARRRRCCWKPSSLLYRRGVSRRRVGHYLGALLGAVLVNALSNGSACWG